MKTAMIMGAWVMAAVTTIAFSQDTNTAAAAQAATNIAATPTPIRTGPVQDDRYDDALKKWNAHEIKNISEIEWLAHTVFTPAEDKQYRAIGPLVSKCPEVQAALKARRDAGFAAMRQADPTIAPVTEKLATAYKTALSEREAMATLTPAEKSHYDKALPAAVRSPEVKAAGQAYKDAVRAAAIKSDPVNGQLIDRLESSYKVIRADFRYQPETKKSAGADAARISTNSLSAGQGL